MIYLLFVIATSVLLGMFWNVSKDNPKKRRKYLFLMFTLLFAFAALRHSSVGIDTANRYAGYSKYLDMSFRDLWRYANDEFAYKLTRFIFSRFFKSPLPMEMAMSAFILGTHLWFFDKHCDDLPLVIELFIIFNFSATLNTTRQYLAISFFLIALHYIMKAEKLRPAILILVGSMFHASAILCLLFVLLAFKIIPPKKSTFLFFIPVVLMLVGMSAQLLDIILDAFPSYAHYLSTDHYGKGGQVSIFWIAVYIIITFLAFRSYPSSKDLRKSANSTVPALTDTDRSFFVLSLAFLAYAMCDIMAFSLNAVYRFMRYFYVGFIILLPTVVMKLFKKDKKTKIVVYLLFLLVGLVVGYIEFHANKYRIFPYRFFWQ